MCVLLSIFDVTQCPPYQYAIQSNPYSKWSGITNTKNALSIQIYADHADKPFK